MKELKKFKEFFKKIETYEDNIRTKELKETINSFKTNTPDIVKTNAENYIIYKTENLEFKEYNISNDLEAKRELIRMGYMSIPVLIIDGEHVLGFDLNRIESLLQK